MSWTSVHFKLLIVQFEKSVETKTITFKKKIIGLNGLNYDHVDNFTVFIMLRNMYK